MTKQQSDPKEFVFDDIGPRGVGSMSPELLKAVFAPYFPRDPKQFAKKSTDIGNVPEGELIMVGGNVVQRNSFKDIRNRMSQELVDITANTCTQALKKLFTEGYFENDEKTLEWLRPLISNYDAARQTISKG